MRFSDFTKQFKRVDVCESVRSYSHLIEKLDDGKVLINGQPTNFYTIDEARQYIKQEYISKKLEQEVSNELYEEISETHIANIIKEHHNLKVTDTIIESYIGLASSKIFTVDPVVSEIRKINKLDVVIENKLHYELNDGSVVAIDYATQESLNKLLQNHKEVVEYMRESADNFLYVVEQIKE